MFLKLKVVYCKTTVRLSLCNTVLPVRFFYHIYSNKTFLTHFSAKWVIKIENEIISGVRKLLLYNGECKAFLDQESLYLTFPFFVLHWEEIIKQIPPRGTNEFVFVPPSNQCCGSGSAGPIGSGLFGSPGSSIHKNPPVI